MELWIRSQDKKRLIKIDNIKVYEDSKDNYSDIRAVFNDYELSLGEYKTKERALEVLDDISSKIKNRYIVKPSAPIISTKDISNEETRLNYLYSGEFIMEEPPFEIKPINNNIIYYEMPKE